MRNQPFAKERSILKTKRAAHWDRDALLALEAQAGRSPGPRENLIEDPNGGEGPHCHPDVVGTGPSDGKAASIKPQLRFNKHRMDGPCAQVPAQGATLKDSVQDQEQGHERAIDRVECDVQVVSVRSPASATSGRSR